MTETFPNPPKCLKIALICDWYSPRLGGFEMHVRDLARELSAAGHEVHILTSTPGEPELDGLKVHRVEPDLMSLTYTFGSAWPISDILRRERYDVAHCHGGYISPGTYASIYMSKRLGIPTVATVHSIWGKFRYTAKFLDHFLGYSRWPVVFSAVSSAVARDIEPVVSPAEVHVIPNGVHAADWKVPPVQRQAGEICIASVMRLDVRKRPRALVRMIDRVRARLPDGLRLKVRVVGDGPLRRSMEELIRDLALQDTIDLLGFKSRREIREILSRADFFVLPSILESFGIAVLEARCAGLPVLARSEGGVKDFIQHGQDGMMASSDDEMMEHILRLAADHDLREAMAAHNRAVPVPGTDWSEVVPHHLRLYQRAHELIPSRIHDRSTLLDAHVDPLTSHVSSAQRVSFNE